MNMKSSSPVTILKLKLNKEQNDLQRKFDASKVLVQKAVQKFQSRTLSFIIHQKEPNSHTYDCTSSIRVIKGKIQ